MSEVEFLAGERPNRTERPRGPTNTHLVLQKAEPHLLKRLLVRLQTIADSELNTVL